MLAFHHIKPGPTLSINSENIREAEVAEVIRHLKNEKAGGIDNILLNALKFVDTIGILSPSSSKQNKDVYRKTGTMDLLKSGKGRCFTMYVTT